MQGVPPWDSERELAGVSDFHRPALLAASRRAGVLTRQLAAPELRLSSRGLTCRAAAISDGERLCMTTVLSVFCCWQFCRVLLPCAYVLLREEH